MNGNTGTNVATREQRELAACPTDLPGNAVQRAETAAQDVRRLIADLRDIDPRQVWGWLNLIGHDDPSRILAALIEAVARIDPDQPESQQLAWINQHGGTKTLHPDHGKTDVTLPAGPYRYDDEIVRLRRDGGLTHGAIALRVGVSLNTVSRALARAGLTDAGRTASAREQHIMQLVADGYTEREIAAQLGIDRRTVGRAKARARARQEHAA
ncbi:helix-turn-helix transcriptional regulator [Amycolatopsis thermophila]|uniref:DNA-binding CsgD family transcriptional regulator n=1 Tax=Amycolatopsis thermophila TaxID=206084 RepID=A0ABU0ESJ2_9PSEU|nr:helix-turn-helix domain-containing protein [Amycolatopsis thermophila]MDQ0377920.1 DNA-binding CsgD family transcriptional regulator [Amycolatopsis thermophila]